MFINIDREQIDNRLACNYIINPHRKVNLLSINFISLLERGTSTIKSMLPFILCDSCKTYPSNNLLTTKLYNLYGATLEATVDVVGLYQVVGINLSFVDNRFSLENENIMYQCSDLLTEILINPNLANEHFNPDNVELVKEFIYDLIQSEYYEKRHLLTRCVQQIQGINLLESCYGNRLDISVVTPKILTDAYKSLLQDSHIEMLLIGTEPSNVFTTFLDKVCNGSQHTKTLYTPFYEPKEITRIQKRTEHVMLSTSKLIIGYSIHGTYDPFALWLFSIIYGNAPFSRLFINLREKEGLCYECYMDYDPFSYKMFFVCNLETENRDKVQAKVIDSLKMIKNNGITHSELDSTKHYAKNRILAFSQSINAIKDWSILQILCNQKQSPIDKIDCIDRISNYQIQSVASAVSINSLYFLNNHQEGG